ncbi:longevity assurance proteins LAG1/LAC1, partial [Nadsonia fulvescens var. elongata DSM 6958]
SNFLSYISKKQVKFSFRILVYLAVMHQFAALRPYTRKFFYIQYVNPSNNLATIGIDDAYFVILSMICLTWIRASLMDYFFTPLARLGGIKPRKALVRFAEQGWSLTYYTISWIYGFYLYQHSAYYMDIKQVWLNWPHHEMTILFKAYYLIQLGCWLQQIFVLNIEERRKDHFQMFSHHVVTCLLTIGSYYYYYTRVGHLILVLMDIVDILLSLAKMMKYLGFSTICDFLFGFFVVTWIISRHVLYNYVVYSAIEHAPKLIEANHCQYDEMGVLIRCFSLNTHWVFISLLIILQIITLVWLIMIINVIYKILMGGSAEDTRSDEEDND